MSDHSHVFSGTHFFRFNIINENEFTIIVKDDDITSDDFIGKGDGTLAKVCVFARWRSLLF